jgi:hypothetical protein
MTTHTNRRQFMKSMAALAALSACPRIWAAESMPNLNVSMRPKKPALIRGAFFYPSTSDVLEGKCEDSWSGQKWFTWPGNQFEPEQQQSKFMKEVKRITAGLDLTLDIDEKPICTDAGIKEFIAGLETSKPAAVVLFNFWNSFSKKLKPILDTFKGPIILYHPVGANHQLPPELFRTAPRVQYIHSIENWEALTRGFRAVHARNRLAQGKVLRVSGGAKEESDSSEPFFGTSIHTIPAAHFNSIFDDMPLHDELKKLAKTVRRRADHITDLADVAFTDGVRAHASALKLLEKHEADAITIECLFLKHRKPCLSFGLNNGNLVPCGCENDLNATMTMLLGCNLFGRGGFQHNPEFDTEQNLYFASHCTCTTKLHGPDGKGAPFDLRPFFHQMPKSLAVDVKWPEGETVTMCKYHSGKNALAAWRGTVVSSPGCPPTGGCATRVLVRMDNVPDICSIYPGPHPVLFCGDFAKHAKTFAQLYELEIKTNV